MRHLVLDSTELHEDLFLGAIHAQILLRIATAGGVVLHVPLVVAMECGRYYSERVTKALDKRETARTSLLELRFESRTRRPPRPTVREIQESYVDKLREIVEAAGGSILPLPRPGHDELLHRELQDIKPFKRDGRGYRDALIWLSVLELLREVGEVEFVTRNHKDFAADDDPERLHLNLSDELVAMGSTPDAVKLRASLKTVVEELTTRASEVIAQVQALLEGEGSIRLRAPLIGWLLALGDQELGESGFDSIFPLVEPRMGNWVELRRLIVDDARDAGDGRFVVTIDAAAEAEIRAKLWPGGAEELGSISELGRWTRELRTEVHGDGSTTASLYAPIWTTFEVIFDPATGEFTSVQGRTPYVSGLDHRQRFSIE